MKTNITKFAIASIVLVASGCVTTLGISPIDNPKLNGPSVASATFAFNSNDNAMAVASISEQEISDGIALCGKNVKISSEFAENWNNNLDVIANAHNEIIAAVRETDQFSREAQKLSFGPQAKALFDKTGISSQQMIAILSKNEPIQFDVVKQISDAYELETAAVAHYLKSICLNIK